jgi:hypothetical protein
MRFPKITRTTFASTWTPIGGFFSPSDAFYGAHGWLASPPPPNRDVVRRPR